MNVQVLRKEVTNGYMPGPNEFDEHGNPIPPDADGERIEEQPLLVARPVGSLTKPRADDGKELLRSRFLSRGGGMLLVSQSGQGKSSLAMQMAILWALCRACFGIIPALAMRILLVQAENDDGDIWEMFHGIAAGLELSNEEIARAGNSILLHNEDTKAGDDFCRSVIEPLVESHKPDLLIIDPALAYLDGDSKDAETVGNFLRRGLNPILHRHECGSMIVHHTTKQKAERPQTTSDFLYSGSGSIEWTNWARAVLALETIGNGCFRLHVPKRGARIGWHDADGGVLFDRFIKHSRTPGQICWHEVDEAEIQKASKTGKSKSDLLAHVPLTGSTPQTILLEKGHSSGIGQRKCRAFLDELLGDGTLHLWLFKRKGTNPEKRVSRQPQPEVQLQP